MISIKDYIRIKKEELKIRIKNLGNHTPILTILQIGNDSSSDSYIKGIKKDCEELGIVFDYIFIKDDKNLTDIEMVQKVYSILPNRETDGIIIQKPIPKRIDESLIKFSVDMNKDIDNCLGYDIFNSCTPKGLIDYLKFNNYKFDDKIACVIGRSNTIGKPLAKMLLELNTTVCVCHSKTSFNNLTTLIDESDIIFTCINQIEYFTEDYFRSYHDIIDFGIGLGSDGKIHGNLTSECVRWHTSKNSNRLIISGAGGTGLLTRIALLDNLILSAEREN